MLEPRTHFEQVPLEIVRKIVEEQIQREKTAKQNQSTNKKTLEEELLEAQEQSMAKSLTFSEVELWRQS